MMNPTERKIAWLDDMIHWAVKQRQTPEVVEWLPWAKLRIMELSDVNYIIPSVVSQKVRNKAAKLTIDDIL